MTTQILEFLYLALSFAVGFVLTIEVKHRLKQRGMVCAVNGRSTHKVPTVRGGGLAFVLVTLSALTGFISLNIIPSSPFLMALFVGGIVIATLGFWDDAKTLSAKIRLPVHCLVVAVCLYFLPPIFSEWVPLWLEKILLLLAWVWFLNLYNFMDGMDGYAGQQTVFLAIAIALLIPSPMKPLLLVLAGATLGFLALNWHPAKVFMGDVGSTFLGFFLGGLLLWHTNPATLPVLFTLPMLFTMDATYTLIKRCLQKKKPWQAHREHWYQRAYMAGLSHSQIALLGIGLNVLLLLICIGAVATGHLYWAIPAGLVPLVLAALWIKRKE